MKKLVLMLFLVVITLPNFAQYVGAEEIEAKNISKWASTSLANYAGVYFFGESESESQLKLILVGENKWVGQISYGEWNEAATAFYPMYINLTSIRIDKDGTFHSDQYTGKFVNFVGEDNSTQKGLKIDNPWTDFIEKGKSEIGRKATEKIEVFFSGSFIQASLKVLTKEELQKYSKEQLQLIRNEIFARYGYLFSKGGKMDTYFSKQEWYRGYYSDVTNFVTELEKQNIALIQEVEKG